MKKIIISALLMLSMSFAFGQTPDKMTLPLRAKLETENGYGKFKFGTPIKQYKNFKRVPLDEVAKMYISKTPIQDSDFKIDSVQLLFHKNELYTISLYIDKDEFPKAIAKFKKAYGSYSSLAATEDVYHWKYKNMQLEIFTAETDGVFEIMFVDLKRQNRMSNDPKTKNDFDEILKSKP